MFSVLNYSVLSPHHSSTGRIMSYSNNSLNYSDLQLYDSHNEQSFGDTCSSQHLSSSPSESHPSNIDILVDEPELPDLVNISSNNRSLPFINNDDDVIGLQCNSNTSGQLYSQSKELVGIIIIIGKVVPPPLELQVKPLGCGHHWDRGVLIREVPLICRACGVRQ